MNFISKEELEKIGKIKETNDRLEEFFEKNRIEWVGKIDPLFKSISQNMNKESFKNVIDNQAYALSYRQILNDQISMFLSKRSKESVKIKNLKEEKFIYFSTSFGIKTSGTQLNMLIESRIGESERNIELIENYVEFLRECIKSLDNYQWTIKNITSLMEYMGK
jgi:hypothetical protein